MMKNKTNQSLNKIKDELEQKATFWNNFKEVSEKYSEEDRLTLSFHFISEIMELTIHTVDTILAEFIDNDLVLCLKTMLEISELYDEKSIYSDRMKKLLIYLESKEEVV